MNEFELVSDETIKVHKIVMRFIKKHKLRPFGCKSFYTPLEWKYRKEEFNQDSLLIIVYDGSELKRLYSDLFIKFNSYLSEYGYIYKIGLHWYGGIYKVGES